MFPADTVPLPALQRATHLHNCFTGWVTSRGHVRFSPIAFPGPIAPCGHYQCATVETPEGHAISSYLYTDDGRAWDYKGYSRFTGQNGIFDYC